MASIDSKSGKVAFTHNKAGKDSVVILGHGYLSSRNSRTNQKLVELLNREGISTIAFDMYGHGESEGDVERLTVTKVVENIMALYDFAKSEGYGRIGLSGSSFTGIVSLIAATKRDFTVLALKCPVFDSKRLWDDRHGMEGLKEWREKGYVKPFEKKWYYEAYEDALQYDMKELAAGISIPVLVVHGDKDVTVDISHARDIVKYVSGEKKLVIIEGADHFFRDEKHFSMMVDETVQWLVSHLK